MKRIILALSFLAALFVAPAAAQTSSACAASAGAYGMIVGGINAGTCYYIVPNSNGSINVVSGGGTPGSPVGITPTDRTITSASGASQQIMAANASRHSLLIVNTGNANCGVNTTGGTAALGSAGTLTLTPAGSFSPRIPTLSAVTVICTAGQPVYANEN